MSRRPVVTALAVVAALAVGLLIWQSQAPPAPVASPTPTPTPTTGPTTTPDPSPTPTPSPSPTPEPLRVEISVLGAASLADAFVALADSFELDNPGVRVNLGFGPSSSLAAQVAAGAPADVLATADERTMAIALAVPADGSPDDEPGGGPVVFALNTLALVVPTTNPGDIDELSDLADPGVTFAMCDEEVPCGAAARRVLEAAGIERDPVTFESDVRGVLTKVLLTEVDAGFVYASDVRATAQAVLEGAVQVVEIPSDLNVRTSYPIAVLPGAAEPEVARAFVAHVLSPAGRQALADAGFLRP